MLGVIGLSIKFLIFSLCFLYFSYPRILSFQLRRIKVVFFQRKKPTSFFSIEQVFDQVRGNQPREIESVVKELRFTSSGLFRRMYGCIESYFCQGDINHITGDIHFIAPFLSRRRTILTVHDIGFMNSAKGISRFIYEWFWIKIPLFHVRYITTVSQATKSELLKYCRIDPDKIVVIHNSLPTFFKVNRKRFDKHKPLILQVGITLNKNVERLIMALKGIPCKLVILGRIQQGHRTLLRENRIDFEELIDLTSYEVVELYNRVDLLAFVSTLEGFGLPIIEANAVGRVVVTSNVSSMPEIAGDAAHLVDPFDVQSIRSGLLEVINNDSYRDKLISNGFENVKRFDVIKIANEYTRLYKMLEPSSVATANTVFS